MRFLLHILLAAPNGVYDRVLPHFQTHDWLGPLVEYLLLIAFFYLGTALTIHLLGARTEAALSMAAAPAVRSKFQPYMEGLRGLLALNIFLIHGADQYNWAKRGIFFPEHEFFKHIGAIAVTYFFFMTGYLLWKGLMENPDFRGSRFLRGRFYRTFPAYAVTITLIFAMSLAKAGFHLRVSPLKFAASYLVWLAFGLVKATTINGYGNLPMLGAGVLWTLQVDWIYYLIFPGLVWFSRKHWRVWLLLGAAVLVYLPIKLHVGPMSGGLKRAQFLLSFFCTCIAVGMAFAVAKARWPEWKWASSRAASCLAVGWMLGMECFVVPHWGIRETLLLLPPFVLLAYGNDFFGLFNSKAALYLGRISYSIYLLHAVVLIGCLHVLRPLIKIGSLSEPMFWLLMAPMGMVTLWVSMLSHRLVELPFTTLGKRRAARAHIPAPLGATKAELAEAERDEAAELPGNAEAELLLDRRQSS